MKKSLCLLIAAAIILTLLPAYAADTDNMERILLSVKERIPDTEAFAEFDSRISTYNNKSVYYFEWYTDSENSYSSLNVSVTDTGIITGYSYYSSDMESEDKPTVNRPSSDEALKKAAELNSRLNPSISDKLRVEKLSETENLFDSQYRFRIVRYENKLPVSENEGYIALDSKAEFILNYNLTYTEDVEFESTADIIDTQQAIASYKESFGLGLKYFNSYADKTKTVYPAYVQSEAANTYISAVTGKPVTIVYSEDNNLFGTVSGGAELANVKNMSASDSALSVPEKNELSNISGLLSEDELIKIVKSTEYISLDGAMEKSGFSIYRDYYNEEKYYASLEFSKKEAEYSYAYYTLDAKTGEILSYSSGKEASQNEKPKITDGEASALMEKAAAHLSGEKFKEFKGDSEDGFHKTYTRYVNGIPSADRISLSVNEFTGKIRSYSIEYTDATFPDISGVLSPDEAADIMFSQLEYIPCYIISDKKAVAVYTVKSPISVRINPFSGKLITSQNKEYEWDKPVFYNDIEGHWAEDIITQLSKFGIGFKSESFSPDAPITQKDYIVLIVSAFISGQPVALNEADDISAETASALRNKIIESSDEMSLSNLTREKAAVYMIRALGIEEYASLSSIYKQPFPDVSQYTGYIAILSGLKVLNGDANGSFNPQKELTRAQAMVMIYNYLSR